MALWLRVMLGRGQIDSRRVVSEQGFRELVAPQMPIEGSASYGLGWEVGRLNPAGPSSRTPREPWGTLPMSGSAPTRYRLGRPRQHQNTRPFREITQLVDSTLLR
jgi:CubicO group peptidase (beta-lactamase class C family)